jgi:hypothetical protein
MGQPALSLFRGDDVEAESIPPGGMQPMLVTEACQGYLDAVRGKKKRSATPRTRQEYRTTLNKLATWWGEILHRSSRPMQNSDLDRNSIKSFLDWVYDQAVAAGDSNPGRSCNKRREHLHAILNWLAEEELIDRVPKFPAEREQEDAAPKIYFDHDRLNALYWATFDMPRPHGWKGLQPAGTYWRAALAVWFTYGVDTQTVFAYDKHAVPLLWRHIYWGKQAPDESIDLISEWGWLYYERKKTGRKFMRPMTREVAEHLRVFAPTEFDLDSPVFGSAGGSRPCERFQELVTIANIPKKKEFPSGIEIDWTIKHFRKTCATFHNLNIPGSASVILGHSLGKDESTAAVTEKHYTNSLPLEFKAITTLPYPEAFRSIWDASVKSKRVLFAK